MITHEDLEGLTEEQIKEVESMLPHDDEYLTPFHKEWNEARVKEIIRVMKSKVIYTADYLRAQSRRMDALVKEMEELERKKRLEKKRSKANNV
jgi:hypothetical protein